MLLRFFCKPRQQRRLLMWVPLVYVVWRSGPQRTRRQRRPSGSACQQPAARRLGVEVLEDRTVPSFLPPVAFPGPSYVGAVGDLNNDGRADLLYSGGYSGTVVVQLSNG